MHPDNLVRPVRFSGHDVYIQGGGVGGEDNIRSAEFIQGFKNPFLDLDVFGGRFDDEFEVFSPAVIFLSCPFR